MMLELTYLSLLPGTVYLAIVGSIVFSVGVFMKRFFNMAPPEVPTLYYRESSLNTYIINKSKLKERHFCPNYFLASRHVQTILPVILPKPEVTYEREYLQMRDKGVIALDWVVHPHVKMKKKTTILVVIPPLTEGASHVTPMTHAAATRGMRAVVFNRRGHGDSFLTTPKLQSYGDPSDLRQLIKYLKMLLPKSPLAAVAYGTGCGLLMSYLGEFGSSSLLTVGVCISPCYDAPARFAAKPSSVYDLLLMVRLKSLLCRHSKALAPVIDVDRAVSTWSYPDFLRNVYGALYGHANMEEFWDMNDPLRDVDDIEVPFLCVNSLDDPICACADIPYDLFKCYPNFLLVTTSKGGHCGFLEGFPPKSWSDSLSLDYVEASVELTTKPSQQSHHRPRFNTVSGQCYSYCNGTAVKSTTRTSRTYLQDMRQKGMSSKTGPASIYRKSGTERFTI
ncbi:abhydrolase domain-containing protein 15 [Biomphalaria pfeifferi]|uniref:Abhydrolase domain-containing protein 15 n=1 Tax=Biomphalaria pfeifferi TaxID=112525 RepID=A0AAD8BGH7_BIOPF|nr:abhydrolase domain-containing protein 15 [Biomphalaria pfeifferi]